MAYEANVANDNGWVAVYEDGGCSFSPDTGLAFDFQVPCKAHDYCYDLRKAGFSGTVSDDACDGNFWDLMYSHCDDRILQLDCEIVADAYYLAVSAPMVVTDPDPALVEEDVPFAVEVAAGGGPGVHAALILLWSVSHGGVTACA